MMLHPELEALFAKTVTVEPYMGEDFYGAPTFGAPVEHPARVQAETVMVRTREGAEKVSSTVALIATSVPFDERSRVTLPDGSQPQVLSIGTSPDEEGEVLCLKVRFT